MKKRLIALTLMLACAELASAAPRPIAPGVYPLTLGTGGRYGSCFPQMNNFNKTLTESGVGVGYTVPVSRHHIIPYNALRDFYNAVVNNNDLESLRGFLQTFRDNLPQYVSAGRCPSHPDDVAGATNLIDMMLAKTVTNGTAPGNADYFADFASFYTWLPGNLFIGPSNRTDDPGNGFETHAASVVGDSFPVYQRLYDSMRSYTNNRDAATLRSAAADLTTLAKKKGVYALDSNAWVQDRQGMYHLR